MTDPTGHNPRGFDAALQAAHRAGLDGVPYQQWHREHFPLPEPPGGYLASLAAVAALAEQANAKVCGGRDPAFPGEACPLPPGHDAGCFGAEDPL